MYKVYCCINNINNKKYIGVTSRTIESRLVGHKSEAYNKNSHNYNTPFKQAIRKYGIENFNIKILFETEDKKLAYEKEIDSIKKYNTYCYKKHSQGYNATLGGEGCSKRNNQIVQLSKDGNFIKVFDSISHAEEELSISHVGECIRGILPTAGDYVWILHEDFNKMSPKEIYDFINLKIKTIVQLDKQGNFIALWTTATQAAQFLKTSDSNIVSAYKGRRKTSNGFVWRTYEDYLNNKNPIYVKEKIYKFSLDGVLVGSYNTIKEAAETVEVSPQVLGRHLNSEYKNYYWERKSM